MGEKTGMPSAGSTKAKSNSPIRTPRPKFLAEIPSGNTLASGDSDARHNSKAIAPPEIPTSKPWPSKRCIIPPVTMPDAVTTSMTRHPIINSRRVPSNHTKIAFTSRCRHEPCSKP